MIAGGADRGAVLLNLRGLRFSFDPQPLSHPLTRPPLLAMSANGNASTALAPGHFLFTSESVGEGHPGKLDYARHRVSSLN